MKHSNSLGFSMWTIDLKQHKQKQEVKRWIHGILHYVTLWSVLLMATTYLPTVTLA